MRAAGLIRTATCRAARGIDEATGEVLPARVLAERVGYLAELVAECGQSVLDAHWDTASIEAISADRAPDGSRMPMHGHPAAAKLWGPASLPAGIKGSSLVARMGAELAARQLRSAERRLQTCTVLLAGGLPSNCPNYVTGEAMRRRIGRRLDRGESLPSSLFDLEPDAPRVPALVPLSAADGDLFTALTGASEDDAHAAVDADRARRRRHNAALKAHSRRKACGSLGYDELPPRLGRTPRTSGVVMVVRLRLPLVARPATTKEWSWSRMVIPIPRRYQNGACSAPTLRVDKKHTVRADVAVTSPSPEPLLEGGQRPVRVLGTDWGARRMLSATVVRALGPPDTYGRYQGAAVDGRPLYFQPGQLQARGRRIATHRNKLRAKFNQWVWLAADLPEDDLRLVELEARRARAQVELDDLAAAQTNLNEQIARLAARWLVEQALAAGCEAIALEDLRTLEHRRMGKRNNERCSLALRGKLGRYTRQAAASVGMNVIPVNARRTSTLCPRCCHQLTHRHRPRGEPGHAWATCGACGYSADRDHAGSENIGRRAIVQGTKPVRHKPTRRRGLRSSHSCGRLRAPKTQQPPSPNSIVAYHKDPSAASDDASAGQAGPAASRLAIPPPDQATGTGHRSAGPGPRWRRQAGRTSKMHAVVPPTRLDGLLTAYRTTLRATSILYREPPWAGVPTSSKQARHQ